MTGRLDIVALSTAIVSLFAQATEVTGPNVPAVITGMTSTGMLIWCVWFFLTKALPSQQEKYTKELEETRQTFSQSLDKILARFEAWQQHTREHHAAEMAALRSELRQPYRAPDHVPKKDAGG